MMNTHIEEATGSERAWERNATTWPTANMSFRGMTSHLGFTKLPGARQAQVQGRQEAASVSWPTRVCSVWRPRQDGGRQGRGV